MKTYEEVVAHGVEFARRVQSRLRSRIDEGVDGDEMFREILKASIIMSGYDEAVAFMFHKMPLDVGNEIRARLDAAEGVN